MNISEHPSITRGVSGGESHLLRTGPFQPYDKVNSEVHEDSYAFYQKKSGRVGNEGDLELVCLGLKSRLLGQVS